MTISPKDRTPEIIPISFIVQIAPEILLIEPTPVLIKITPRSNPQSPKQLIKITLDDLKDSSGIVFLRQKEHLQNPQLDVRPVILPDQNLVFDDVQVAQPVLNFAAFCITRALVVNNGHIINSDSDLDRNQLELKLANDILMHNSSSESYDNHIVLTESEDSPNLILAKIGFILQKAKELAHIRTCEILITLIILDTFSNKELNPTFIVTQKNIYIILLGAMMLSHKSISDVPYSNGWWSRTFDVSNHDLNEVELMILKQLQFRVTIPTALYQRYFDALVKILEYKGDETQQ
ncbi:MAG: hypothetical protein EZS28_034786 [Streblomastix strix]|uniref:Cyclin N-terminal domain-containing protein n=1 Tax=Streblomastix strix TaxID=222440 RepID=A0A5J4UH09_9EUKA|nr:MAG: hypothetical protein EZS28_034786 [Streblomastix strix]